MLSFLDSTELLSDGAALRERAESEGYLFFQGLLPREEVLCVRRELLRVVKQHGWLAPSQGELGGRLDLDVLGQVPEEQMDLGIGVTHSAYADVQKLESVHALPHHPVLLSLYKTLFDAPVLVHPRHIVRMITAHPAIHPTPPHQDFPHVQGTPRTWTAWMPLGDCPHELGGLAVLRASQHNGYLPIQPAPGAGGIAAQLCPGETEWITGDYHAGDVLTFPAFTVHKGLSNQHREFIRLSLDVRYQPASEPVELGSLRPHCALSWEQIYEGWKSDQFQFYWREDALHLVPWNNTYRQFAHRIC